MGDQPVRKGSPLPVRAAAPAPQVVASTVAPQITRGIFGAGSQPCFGRLSALSRLRFRGGGDKPPAFSMGMRPEGVCVSRAWGLGMEGCVPGPVVGSGAGACWPVETGGLRVVHRLLPGSHPAPKATDTTTNSICLCPKMRGIFHCHDLETLAFQGPSVPHPIPHLHPADTIRQPQRRHNSLLSPPHCWEQRDGLMGQAGVCGPSPVNGGRAVGGRRGRPGSGNGRPRTWQWTPAPGFSAPFIKMSPSSLLPSSLHKSYFPVHFKQ